MSDVRKMTNEGLLQGVRGCFMDRGFIRLPEELEELARRVGIMEELCEAASGLSGAVADDLPMTKDVRRLFGAIVAYRALKGEQDA